MSRLAADAARVAAGHSVSDRTGCPLCGRAVVYRGLTDVECESLHGACPNGGRHPKPAPEASGDEYDYLEATAREALGSAHQERFSKGFQKWYPALPSANPTYGPKSRWRMAPGWTWVPTSYSPGLRTGYEYYNDPGVP